MSFSVSKSTSMLKRLQKYRGWLLSDESQFLYDTVTISDTHLIFEPKHSDCFFRIPLDNIDRIHGGTGESRNLVYIIMKSGVKYVCTQIPQVSNTYIHKDRISFASVTYEMQQAEAILVSIYDTNIMTPLQFSSFNLFSKAIILPYSDDDVAGDEGYIKILLTNPDRRNTMQLQFDEEAECIIKQEADDNLLVKVPIQNHPSCCLHLFILKKYNNTPLNELVLYLNTHNLLNED